MGLRANVFTTPMFAKANTSASGISHFFDQVTVVNIDGPAEPDETAPAVILVEGPLGSLRIVPASQELDSPRRVGPMAGGSFVSSTDSRFAEKVRELGGSYGAIAFHDRFER